MTYVLLAYLFHRGYLLAPVYRVQVALVLALIALIHWRWPQLQGDREACTDALWPVLTVAAVVWNALYLHAAWLQSPAPGPAAVWLAQMAALAWLARSSGGDPWKATAIYGTARLVAWDNCYHRDPTMLGLALFLGALCVRRQGLAAGPLLGLSTAVAPFPGWVGLAYLGSVDRRLLLSGLVTVLLGWFALGVPPGPSGLGLLVSAAAAVVAWWLARSYPFGWPPLLVALTVASLAAPMLDGRLIPLFAVAALAVDRLGVPIRSSRLRFALVTALALLIQYWVASAGFCSPMPSYETIGNHYWKLAEAFEMGQLHLNATPDPKLLAAPDPFDPFNQLPKYHDASLYRGKFYLYFGPVPALVLMAVRPLGLAMPNEAPLVLLLAGLTTAAGAWILAQIWRQEYSDLPATPGLLALTVLGLCSPMLHCVGRGAVYEGAVMGGQAFLLASLGCCLRARVAGPLWLAPAGFCLGLAEGSRVSLILAVAWLGLLVPVWAWRRWGLAATAAFCVPLGLVAIGLGIYNYVRFDSFTQFGHYYQLTTYHPQKPGYFSTSYIPTTAMEHLLRPPGWQSEFPFLKYQDARLPFTHEKYVYGDPMVGQLWVTPFLLLALLSLKAWRRWWVLQALPLLAILPGLRLITSAVRYSLDWLPIVLILAAIGMWEVRAPRRLMSLAAVLALVSVVLSLGLAITGQADHFKHFNLPLFDWMRQVATPR